MKRFLLRAFLVLIVAVAGCEHDCYLIELTPDGKTFQRKLTCWHEDGRSPPNITPLAPEKLARLKELYGRRETPEGAEKHVFLGRFTNSPPADIGGAGSYTHLVTPLGSLFGYVERFRGNDDLESELAKRRAATDRLIGLLLGWCRAELADVPNVDRLYEFVDVELRRDLTNLGLYTWTGNAVSGYQPGADKEFLVRAGQYLCERGYFTPKQLPALARAVWTSDPAPVLTKVQRLLARKMGIADSQPVPKSLAIFSDPKRLKVSWDKYLRGTELFKQRVAAWHKEKKKPDAKPPGPDDVVGELLGDALYKFQVFSQPDTLELKLFCGQQPFATNGAWKKNAGAVAWRANLAEHPSLPVVCFASWSEPNQAAQQTHFGKVVLRGKDLAGYVLWYHALTPDESGQWNRMIARCKPGAGLKSTIGTFRFAGDPKPDPNKPDEVPPSLADTPRKLILKALEK